MCHSLGWCSTMINAAKLHQVVLSFRLGRQDLPTCCALCFNEKGWIERPLLGHLIHPYLSRTKFKLALEIQTGVIDIAPREFEIETIIRQWGDLSYHGWLIVLCQDENIVS